MEDAGAPSGHVLLVAGGQVGGAHERAGHSGAALADARAAVDGGREVAAVVGEREAAVGGHGAGGDAAQVRIEGVNAGLELVRATGGGAARAASAVGRGEAGTTGACVVTIAEGRVRPAVCRQPVRTPAARCKNPRPSARGGLGLVHGGGEHSGVEEVVWVEEVLDAGEQVEHLGGVHEAQEFAAGASVAVFAGDGAAVGGADAGRGLQEGARVGDAVGGF